MHWLIEDPATHAINRRLAALSGTDVDQGEPLQILRYRPGQEYRPHLDLLVDENPRILTALVYLNEDYAGGETEFVKTGPPGAGPEGRRARLRSRCRDGGMRCAIRACRTPVTSGTKYLASRWIRARHMCRTSTHSQRRLTLPPAWRSSRPARSSSSSAICTAPRRCARQADDLVDRHGRRTEQLLDHTEASSPFICSAGFKCDGVGRGRWSRTAGLLRSRLRRSAPGSRRRGSAGCSLELAGRAASRAPPSPRARPRPPAVR